MICERHRWSRKTLPCPYLLCPNGTRGHLFLVGSKVWARTRDKTERGPVYGWQPTKIDPSVMRPAPIEAAPDHEPEDDLVF